jgi:hypothetical protein
LEICLSRGFKVGSHGHGEGRAADIAAVGGKALIVWKQEWEQAVAAAEKLPEAQTRAEAIAAEQQRNLGYALYKALQAHGGWAQPQGYPVQLFGPWTRGEGPHKAISDQLLNVHRDHIHVAN